LFWASNKIWNVWSVCLPARANVTDALGFKAFLTPVVICSLIYTKVVQQMAQIQKARVFMNGRSQAVRIPFEYRFTSDEVYIRRDPQSET
jgi:hypothetical protein